MIVKITFLRSIELEIFNETQQKNSGYELDDFMYYLEDEVEEWQQELTSGGLNVTNIAAVNELQTEVMLNCSYGEAEEYNDDRTSGRCGQ